MCYVVCGSGALASSPPLAAVVLCVLCVCVGGAGRLALSRADAPPEGVVEAMVEGGRAARVHRRRAAVGVGVCRP